MLTDQLLSSSTSKPGIMRKQLLRFLITSSAFFFFAALLVAPSRAQNVITIEDSDLVGDTEWTRDNTYVLNGFVFVEDGETLTIEAGTVIKGMPGQGENASALIVARGGQIFAEGTPSNPIIFTAEADDVNDPDDLPLDARGLWGGILILGQASLNSSPGETAIEGIPTTEPRGIYGCGVTADCDDADNSGVIRYVSVRYGGSDIGAGNEINGITFGGVGRGTTAEFLEVFNNQDDGFEWFGGTVNTSHLISAFNGDDAFDYDEGFRGNGQFWFAIQDDETANRGGEHDGGTDPEDGQPYAIPVISNATYIGSGAGSANADNDVALKIRDNAGGRYFNSIFTEYVGHAVDIEDLDSGEDSRTRLEAGDLELRNNIFGDFGSGTDPATFLSEQDFVVTYLMDAANANVMASPELRSISREANGALDPRPALGTVAFTTPVMDLDDPWFADVDFLGAFGETNWAADWSFLADVGILTTSGAGRVEYGVAVEQLASDIPSSFGLDQNYPNPFNPSTTIEFQLDQMHHVRLAVYDLMGREVALLLDGSYTPGTYSVQFDARDLASGTYIYQLRTPEGVKSRTMVLLK